MHSESYIAPAATATATTTTFVKCPFFQVNLGHPVPPRVLLLQLLGKRTSGISGTGFSTGGTFFLLPN